MPVLNYIRRSDDNDAAAKSLLEEGDEHLAQGDKMAALSCYIKVADMVWKFPQEYARKAAETALQSYSDSPVLEGHRIAGCFLSFIPDAKDSEEMLEKKFDTFAQVLACWKNHNLKPQQHLIFTGEGGKTYLLELMWNEGGELHESVRDNPGVMDNIAELLQKKPLYVVSLDTLYGWRPFSIMPVSNNDAELLRTLPAFARGGISYASPRLRPLIVELIERGGNTSNLPESPAIPATMNWYENYGYLDNGFGKLDGLIYEE